MAEVTPVEGVEPVVTPADQVDDAAETDWKAQARKWEARAKDNLARANANDDAAKRLAEIEESQKTEAQKQQEALEKAQRELAELTVAKTRAEVAADKGVPAALLSGSTQEELEASADALLSFRGESTPVSPFPKADPSQGAKGAATGGSNADRFAAFMESKLT
jgi:hypothetical protein